MMVDEIAKFACLLRVIGLIVPLHGSQTFAHHYRAFGVRSELVSHLPYIELRRTSAYINFLLQLSSFYERERGQTG